MKLARSKTEQDDSDSDESDFLGGCRSPSKTATKLERMLMEYQAKARMEEVRLII